jgi:nucleoside-diphosphate-sugar epimerase
MLKTIVITGAAGNLSRKLRKRLADQSDYRLRLLDIEPAGDAQITAANLASSDEAWARCFEGADAVVHLAGVSTQLDEDWGALTRANIDAVLNVYAAAARHGVRRVVLASSVWVMADLRYGAGPITADPEGAPGDNRYGVTKLFGERAARSFYDLSGVSTVALRIGACRDGDNRPSEHVPMPDWNRGCWLSDHDFCEGVLRAIAAEDVGFAVINLVSDNPGSRWTLDEGERLIGYRPRDGASAHPRGWGLRGRLARFGRVNLPRLLRRTIPQGW